MGSPRLALKFLFILLSLSMGMVGCPDGSNKVECGPPISSAGNDQDATTGQRVILHGSFRLPPDEEPACQQKLPGVQFTWEQTQGPDVSIDNADQVETSFVPTVPGDYGFRAKAIFPEASDPSLAESQWDSVNIHVEQRFCGPPAADAGADQLLPFEGAALTVNLDGLGSQPSADCPELEIIRYTWTMLEQPIGSDAIITAAANPAQASFAAGVLGDYVIQLEIQDSLGSDGRVDTSAASVRIQLVERTTCEDTLAVTVIAAEGGQAIQGAHVWVIDANDQSHQADTGADGLASFSGLSAGRRKSITVRDDSNVSALPGTGDPNPRLRHQVVSVLDHCSSRIQIPLPLTDSGQSDQASGVVTAKIPQSLFDSLPHSQKFAGACATDGDCTAGYVCATTPMGDDQCTPRSLLPVFGLDDPNISGQFRGFILMPAMDVGNLTRFPTDSLLAPPPNADAFLPGNLATDDAFLNGLAPGLGLDVWGADCSTTADCPDAVNYICEADDAGHLKCRDRTALHNVRLIAPAGTRVPLVLIGAVVDVGMENLLPILSTFLTADDEELVFDLGGLLGAFQIKTLYVCILHPDVAAGAETDVSDQIEALDPADCWAVDYQQQEIIVPIPDTYAIRPDNTCAQDADCGWPGDNKRCLASDSDQPNVKHCLVPLYRVRIISDQTVQIQPAVAGADPSSSTFDQRLCGDLPATTRYQHLCPGPGGAPKACDPVEWCDLTTPAETECALPYGLSVLTADFPEGHADFPTGGRVVLGFSFNISPFSAEPTPVFLAPDLNLMGATSLAGTQFFIRNISQLPNGRYQLLPGGSSASRAAASNVRTIDLPVFPTWPNLDEGLDAGIEVVATVIPDDPLAACGQASITRTYATGQTMLGPNSGQHDLGTTLTVSNWGPTGMTGAQLSLVNRVDPGDGTQIDLRDRQWLFYIPAGSQSVVLPADGNPFTSGQEVWVSLFQAGFQVPYDHDLFSTDLLLERQASRASDDYALLVP